MIGIIVNCYTISNSNQKLFLDLIKLAYIYKDITVQVNVTNADFDDLDPKVYKLLTVHQRFNLTVRRSNQYSLGLTNGQLRGQASELNADYIFHMDDDFKICNEKAFAGSLHAAQKYMNDHPTCQLIRFKFNNNEIPEVFDQIKVYFPISSTSMACGLFIRNDVPGFTQSQLRWHWRTDDFTLVLNALSKGYGVEIEGHGLAHLMKGTASECIFDPSVLEGCLTPEEIQSLTDSEGKIPYLKNDSSEGLRQLLIKKLKHIGGWNNIIHTPNIVSTSPASMLMDNDKELCEVGMITYLSRRTSDPNARVITNPLTMNEKLRKTDVLILSAGTLGEEFLGYNLSIDDNIDTIKWNLEKLEVFLKSHSEGVVIYLGSVAEHRGYPKYPGYAAEKSFMLNYLKSIDQKLLKDSDKNISFHYLTIPSVKSNMCDHGYESSAIIEHIKLLSGHNHNQREVDNWAYIYE